MSTSPFALLSLLTLAAAAEPVFKATTVDDKITIGYGLAIGDVDGDRKPDILLADAKEIVWYQNPGWKKSVIARNLTLRDNVCIAARDLNGDGKVEIAVGAQWNPGETSNTAESGAVLYLQRPDKDGEMWKPVPLPHEPTTHRMHWVRTGKDSFSLVVLPLHGRGNTNGAGANGVKIIAYAFPKDDPSNAAAWTQVVIDDTLHVTHNFDLRPAGGPVGGPDRDVDELIIGGKEALLSATPDGAGWRTHRLDITETGSLPVFGGVGELRFGRGQAREGHGAFAIACIEPFHGPNLTLFKLYADQRTWKREVLDTTFNQGHALATGVVFEQKGPLERTQIVAGWREPNAARQFGIKIYHEEAGTWKSDWVCEPNTMACEDLKLADLDADGKPEIIAAGRATKNVVIYKLQP